MCVRKKEIQNKSRAFTCNCARLIPFNCMANVCGWKMCARRSSHPQQQSECRKLQIFCALIELSWFACCLVVRPYAAQFPNEKCAPIAKWAKWATGEIISCVLCIQMFVSSLNAIWPNIIDLPVYLAVWISPARLSVCVCVCCAMTAIPFAAWLDVGTMVNSKEKQASRAPNWPLYFEPQFIVSYPLTHLLCVAHFPICFA